MAKILCIDDDPDIIESCRVTLEAEGHTVEEAANGDLGYEKAKSFKPDMIILDVMMQNDSEGFHTAYKFRGDAALKLTPILMLTSVTEKTGFKFNPAKDGAFLPVDDFIAKPIAPKQLIELTNRLLALPKDQINASGK